tara:strand:+ start:518 stop:1063 length:546 start_codon:yes stop_codon:yes gene_type:complete
MRELQSRLHCVSDSHNNSLGVLVSYTGPLHEKSGDSILLLAESAVSQSGSARKEMKRVCNVLIECIQNVHRHGWIDKNGEILLYLTIEHTPVGFQIQCGNIIDLDMAATLRSKLNIINGMDHFELRKRYIEVLCEAGVSEKGGAGLGLMSMAKRCAGPIEYELTEQDNDLFLFTLTATVKG